MGYSIPPNSVTLPLPAGERRVTCGYCGAKYMRSDCRRDASGFIVCCDCDDGGRDQVTLDRLNAQAAAAYTDRRNKVPPDW